MKMLLPLFALIAAPALAQDSALYFASDAWPVRKSGTVCTMARTAPAEGESALSVTYDAAKGEVTVAADNPVTDALPESGSIDLAIVFLDNGGVEYDDAWGTRRFDYSREDGAARFATRFAGERNVRQILADLSGSAHVGFLHRGEAVMWSDLAGARRPLLQLQECAARALASN